MVEPPVAAMSIRPDPQTLITALTQARLSGQLLRAAEWAGAVHSEAEAYAVQDGVVAALSWLEGPLVRHWKSGGATRSGPFSHAPLDPAGINSANRPWPLLGVEAEVALRLGRDVSPEAARAMAPVTHTGSHSLNDPAWLLPAWLQHLTRHGAIVAAGTVVTTGSWVGCLPVQPGDRVSVDFAGLGNLTAQL